MSAAYRPACRYCGRGLQWRAGGQQFVHEASASVWCVGMSGNRAEPPPRPFELVRAVHAKDAKRLVLIRETPSGAAVGDETGARSGDWLRRTEHESYGAAVAYYQDRCYAIGNEHTAAYFTD